MMAVAFVSGSTEPVASLRRALAALALSGSAVRDAFAALQQAAAADSQGDLLGAELGYRMAAAAEAEGAALFAEKSALALGELVQLLRWQERVTAAVLGDFAEQQLRAFEGVELSAGVCVQAQAQAPDQALEQAAAAAQGGGGVAGDLLAPTALAAEVEAAVATAAAGAAAAVSPSRTTAHASRTSTHHLLSPLQPPNTCYPALTTLAARLRLSCLLSTVSTVSTVPPHATGAGLTPPPPRRHLERPGCQERPS
jgi:hypothetical protein